MKTVHLVVEIGEETGREIHIPPAGARLGRSSKNDVVLPDPRLSRHHCRVYFKPDEGMYITDLGSSNKTVVNGKEIIDTKIKPGDRILIGDTTLKVVNDGTDAAGADGAPVIDLGLSPAIDVAGEKRKKIGIFPLLITLVVFIAIAATVWLPKFRKTAASSTPAKTHPAQVVYPELGIDYEKIEADTGNIFRYKLQITPDNEISIAIDDLVNNRTVRKEKNVDPELIKELVRDINDSGFFTLNPEYTGVQPDIFNQWDLSITLNKRTHSVRILNRPEPDAFHEIREKIEVFGKNELGLWAIQFSTEKLIEMAEAEYLQGKKLFDEREVKYGNLAESIRNFEKAKIDLETVEPKPEFYADTITSIREGKQLLQEKYDELYFQAERSIRLEEWGNAAEKLRIIQELIPDRTDERNLQARRNLLNVEAHLKAAE